MDEIERQRSLDEDDEERANGSASQGDTINDVNTATSTLDGETPLMTLCRLQDWPSVMRRANTHRHECMLGTTTGETTALSLAIRRRAPRNVLQALLEACPQQVNVVQRQTPTTLSSLHDRSADCHEPSRTQQSPGTTILHQTIQAYHHNNDCNPKEMYAILSSMIQNIKFRQDMAPASSQLWAVQDALGRTALHHLVEQQILTISTACGFANAQHRAWAWQVFQQLVQAHPEALVTMDVDGNTPLVFLLAATCPAASVTNNDCHYKLIWEKELLRRVTYMLQVRPTQVWVAPQKNQGMQQQQQVRLPLYHALRHGRSVQIVASLLQAHKETTLSGSLEESRRVHPCAMPLTRHGEVAMHVAVTQRSTSLDVLRLLAHAYPAGSWMADNQGYTPVDWLWTAYVVDMNAVLKSNDDNTDTGENAMGPQTQSRRFLPASFGARHENVAACPVPYKRANRYDCRCQETQQVARDLQNQLLERARIILPLAAAAVTTDTPNFVFLGSPRPWPLLHAACLLPSAAVLAATVPCYRRTMVELLLALDPDAARQLHTPDQQMGRLPLHHAVSSPLWPARARLHQNALCPDTLVPKADDNDLSSLSSSLVHFLVSEFPGACWHRDRQGQLPLHVAIDGTSGNPQHIAEQVVESLLQAHPNSISERDGRTELYPWQQAAVGKGCSVSLVYSLLCQAPNLCTT